MVYYDTDSRIQLAREHADRLTAEMRRSRRATPERDRDSWRTRFAAATGDRMERLRHTGRHAPALDA
jgi:hypothetical protein